MTSSLVTSVLLAAAEEAHGKELPMPPWAVGLITFALLMARLGFLWSFRHHGMKFDPNIQDGEHHPTGASPSKKH